jgi:ribonuclease HI
MATRLEFKCMNNRAEYEALIMGLEALLDTKARNVEACKDSQLDVNESAVAEVSDATTRDWMTIIQITDRGGGARQNRKYCIKH